MRPSKGKRAGNFPVPGVLASHREEGNLQWRGAMFCFVKGLAPAWRRIWTISGLFSRILDLSATMSGLKVPSKTSWTRLAKSQLYTLRIAIVDAGACISPLLNDTSHVDQSGSIPNGAA